MKRGMSNAVRWIIIILVILVIAFFVWKYKDLFFGEKVVRVENCGDLNSQALRDDCCSVRMKDQIHIQCVGNWKYGEKDCEFVCS